MPDFTLKSAAQWSHGLPHQVSAWDWLQSQLDPKILDEFKLRYRNQYRIDTMPAQYRIPEQALSIIKEFEGLYLEPYTCPAGVPTIGWGTTVYPNGQKVKLTDPMITEEEAEVYLVDKISKDIVPLLHKHVPFWSSMSSNQRAALISFAYNLGAHFMSTSSGFETLQRQLRNKEWNSIPQTLLLYRNPGTKFEAGLLRRRHAEAHLWQGRGPHALES